MKFRDGILFLVFFGVFIIVLNVKFSARQPYLRLCDPYQVTDFHVQTKKKDVIAHLDSATGDWLLRTPNGDEALGSLDTIKTVTALACALPYVEKFTLDPAHADEELQAFGIKGTKKRFTIAVGKNENVLEIGNETASGTEFYFRVLQEPNIIYTTTDPRKATLTLSFLDLRSHFPLDLLDQSDGLKIIFGNSELSFKRKDEAWYDETGLLTMAQTEELIQSLRSFQYTHYRGPLEDKKGEIKKEFVPYGLDLPDVTLEFKTPKDPQALIFKLLKYGAYYHLTQLFNQKTYLLILKPESPHILYQKLEALAMHE